MRLVSHAVIGGTTSVLAGGKFQNGAVTAAFAYLFNEAAGGAARRLATDIDVPGDIEDVAAKKGTLGPRSARSPHDIDATEGAGAGGGRGYGGGPTRSPSIDLNVNKDPTANTRAYTQDRHLEDIHFYDSLKGSASPGPANSPTPRTPFEKFMEVIRAAVNFSGKIGGE